jgi:hypothetical protein
MAAAEKDAKTFTRLLSPRDWNAEQWHVDIIRMCKCISYLTHLSSRIYDTKQFFVPKTCKPYLILSIFSKTLCCSRRFLRRFLRGYIFLKGLRIKKSLYPTFSRVQLGSWWLVGPCTECHKVPNLSGNIAWLYKQYLWHKDLGKKTEGKTQPETRLAD